MKKTLVFLILILFAFQIRSENDVSAWFPVQKTRIDHDTIWFKNTNIVLVKISPELRGAIIDSSIINGKLDQWLGDMKEKGFIWTGTFGYPSMRPLVGYNTGYCTWIPFHLGHLKQKSREKYEKSHAKIEKRVSK
jgi:hypothetical protein